MPGSLVTEFGACGFGRSGGLIPEIRLGWIRVWWCRGSVSQKFADYSRSLADSKAMTQMLLCRFRKLVEDMGKGA